MLFSRRALLYSGTAAAGLTAVGVPVSVLPSACPGFQLLSEGEVALVAAIGEAFFPSGSALAIGAADVGLPFLVDTLLAEELDPVVQPVFRYLLRAVDAGTVASRGSSFALLPLEDRRAVLDTWSDNAIFPRRVAYDALKSVLGMAFFNAPEVTERIGWSPTCHPVAS